MRFIAFLVALAVFVAGVWLFGSPLSRAFADATDVPSTYSSIAFIGAWFLIGAIGLLVVRRRRPPLVLPAAVALGLTVAAVSVLFGYTHLVDDKADDDVSFADEALPAAGGATAEGPARPLLVAEGQFSGIDHSASGRARIVALPDGERRLVFTEFDVERAPDLRVYMAADRVDGDVGDYEELDKLKGNVGDQYYVLPKSLDLSRYQHVVIWCKAFDVGVAQAPLEGRS